jgi:hypothetical protein
VLSVELGADVGLPVFGDLGKFFGDVHFGHEDLFREGFASAL